MYTRIVVGIDGSELATKALRHALVLGKEMNARLLIMTSTDPSVLVAPGAEFMAVDTSSVIPDMDAAKAKVAEATLTLSLIHI